MANIHAIYRKLSPLFRRKRMARFFSTLKPAKMTRVLDLGGLAGNWRDVDGEFPVTMVNLKPHSAPEARFTSIQGDVLRLPFKDQSFDIVFSNSVIEHLGGWENQQLFAREAARIAPKMWIQTPAYCFPVEPHLLAAFVHWLPRSLQQRTIRWFSIWGWINKPSRKQVDDFLAEVRLLSYREMQLLFPSCEIFRERFFGFTKCYIAVKN